MGVQVTCVGVHKLMAICYSCTITNELFKKNANTLLDELTKTSCENLFFFSTFITGIGGGYSL